MTGYGQGVARNDLVEVTAEIKSVNNRFLETVIKLPRILSSYENDARDLVSKRMHRGRIMVWLNISKGAEQLGQPVLNKDLVKKYLQMAAELESEFSLAGDLTLSQLMNFPDVVAFHESGEDLKPLWQCAKDALQQGLDQLVAMRKKEGAELEKDLKQRIKNIMQRIEKIESLAHNAPREELMKLQQRLQTLLNGKELDPERLEMEVAMIADKLDITEECVRFGSHNRLFLDAIDAEQPEGRKLNFLLQEMHREANTIAAKVNSAEIAHLVIEIKENIEQLREQVQNIE
jgi:uncharacterized protein (TIGR00255 family)